MFPKRAAAFENIFLPAVHSLLQNSKDDSLLHGKGSHVKIGNKYFIPYIKAGRKHQFSSVICCLRRIGDFTMEYSVYEKRSGSFATASLVLGIVGTATGCCVYTGLICGALAILFALLSRGGEMTLTGRGKAGLTLGIIAVSVAVLFYILMVCYAFYYYGSEYFNQMYEELYQMDSYQHHIL